MYKISIQTTLFVIFLINVFSCQPKIISYPSVKKKSENLVPHRDHLSKINTFERQYPNHSYITALVQDAKSLREAEEEAKKNISASIKSELKSKVKSTQTQVVDNQGSNLVDTTTIIVEMTSDFKHAELIKIEANSRSCEMIDQENHCTVFAYLERKALADQLFFNLSDIQTRLEAQIKKMDQNLIHSIGFSSNDYALFKQDFKNWYPLAFEIHSILPNYIKNYEEIKKKSEQIEKKKAEILTQQQIYLMPSKVNYPKVGRALLKPIKQILSKLNLHTKDAVQCQKGYALEIEGHLLEEERSSMMGKKKLFFETLKLNLIECPNQNLQSIDLPEIFVYEVYHKSMEDHLIDRIENKLFNENDKNYESFKSKISDILKDVLPI
jgi:hypothetical protein